MATKDEIITTLKTLGIDHDPASKKDDLEALIPVAPTTPVDVPVIPEAPTPFPVDVAPIDVPQVDPRQVGWDAFLAKARLVNPKRFDEQKANHEFDKIPDNFTS